MWLIILAWAKARRQQARLLVAAAWVPGAAKEGAAVEVWVVVWVWVAVRAEPTASKT